MDDARRADRLLREVADRFWRATYDRPVLRAGLGLSERIGAARLKPQMVQ